MPKSSLVQLSHSFSTHIDAKFGSNRCKAIWRNIIKMIYFYGGAADARARCFVSIINFQFKVALGCFTCQSGKINEDLTQQQQQQSAPP
jgi:hypothetical protein